jgi:hypothetical protein
VAFTDTDYSDNFCCSRCFVNDENAEKGGNPAGGTSSSQNFASTTSWNNPPNWRSTTSTPTTSTSYFPSANKNLSCTSTASSRIGGIRNSTPTPTERGSCTPAEDQMSQMQRNIRN